MVSQKVADQRHALVGSAGRCGAAWTRRLGAKGMGDERADGSRRAGCVPAVSAAFRGVMSGLTSEASVESAGTPAPEGTRRRAHRPSVDARGDGSLRALA